MYSRSLKLSLQKSFFLFGPRQVGKTTLIQEIISQEESIFYNFLLSEIFNKFAADPKLFREEVLARDKKHRFIIVDEVQRIPDLLNEIHFLIEQDKSLIFILSGSSARKLKRNQANLLGGRALSYKLFPLTHQELGEDFNLKKALNYGTLPDIYKEQDKNLKIESLYSYVETYLEEEIKAEAVVRQVGGFIRFLKFAAYENGNTLNYSNIARETANKAHIIKEYFQILEDTLIGFWLLAYDKSTRTRLIKHPKFYFFDTGVQRAICGQLELELQEGTKEYGHAFEHFIVKEILNIANYRRKKYTFSYFRTENGAEVDLIIETPQKKIWAIEIKSSTRPSLSSLKGLKSFAKICNEAELICACQSEREFQYGNIKVTPWKKLFVLLDLTDIPQNN